MKIAFLHFHLKTGGVTTVIRQQVEALKGTCETLVLSGAVPENDFPCKVISIPGLGYDSDTKCRDDHPDQVAAAITRSIQAQWPGGCDILHVHNPTLAKNRCYLSVLKRLQARGLRLFLQIHDFAEDGRPAAYFKERYPADCHYGVINSRDYAIMLKAGLTPQGLHLVGNMVTPLPAAEQLPETIGPVVYPVRAIRRKNIGEAILLSCFFPSERQLLITLPPNSPADFPAYESWKRFVALHSLPVSFEVGLESNFTAIVQGAHSLLTTSISEGFGFSFMEPWTAEKFLWGRDLPGITDDFKANGINLNHLYTELQTPTEWINPLVLLKLRQIAAAESRLHFGNAGKSLDPACFLGQSPPGGMVDFGLLNEGLQQAVVSKLLESAANREKFIRLNPFLSNCPPNPPSSDLIARNRERVMAGYSKKIYQKALLSLYAKVAAVEPVQAVDKEKLLSEFFKPSLFTLLKWGHHAA